MPRITIDDKPVDVPEGSTILDAARVLGIEIPTLCFLPGRKASTSCMVCLVKDRATSKLMPSCGTPVRDGMAIDSETDEVRAARHEALELLLSDHLGDCDAPCQRICPAGMNIPLMLRQIAMGDLQAAARTVKADIPLASVLGRICPELCERGCRRKDIDQPVSICLLKGHVGDADLATGQPIAPTPDEPSGKRVAIVGAGPAGLTAAFYLLDAGHAVEIFDDRDQPGGMVRYGVGEADLDRSILDAEIEPIGQAGAVFHAGIRIGVDRDLVSLRDEFDAVLLAVGIPDPDEPQELGVPTGPRGLEVNHDTFETPMDGVFAAGGAIRPIHKQAVRAVGDGHAAARIIDGYLRSGQASPPDKEFYVHIGKLREGEGQLFLAEASDRPRQEPADRMLTAEQAAEEARRCLHCDCRASESCRLRRYAREYEVKLRPWPTERRTFSQDRSHEQIVYEAGKCIDCGICVQIAREEGEQLGLSFIGRGFDVRVGVPMGGTLGDAIPRSARRIAEHCPTGAFSLWEGDDPSGGED